MSALITAIDALEQEYQRLTEAAHAITTALTELRRLTPDAGPRAAQAARQAPRAKTPTRAAVTRPAAPTHADAASPRERAAAREAIILRHLTKSGGATFSEILAALPVEPGKSDDQHRHACANALVRMKGRDTITLDAEGRYALA